MSLTTLIANGSECYRAARCRLLTQEQATLLRALPRKSSPIDIDNVADEIEALGRSEVRHVTNLLVQTASNDRRIAVGDSSTSYSRTFKPERRHYSLPTRQTRCIGC
ncbi:DUF29 family protein [Mycoplana dimorpha]|uniref:DUF29 family protein n=1 Tax=Mycoplana dimorpha TaxID=28320 RepID=UPI0035BBE3CE